MSGVNGSVYLAFDFGTQRIGLAVGDTVTGTARELAAVPPDWKRIGAVLADWKPQVCVVGLPLAEDGGEQPITRRAREFAAELATHFTGPVHLCDERYSSKSALQALRGERADGTRKRRLRPGDKDSAAARLILEQWLGEAKAAAGRGPS